MQIFHNRPLALAACIFALAAVAGTRVDRGFKLALLVAFLLLFVILTGLWLLHRIGGRRTLTAWLCLGAVCLSLLSSFLFFNLRYASLQERNGSECRVCGTVLERIDAGSFYSFFRVRVTSLDGEREDFDAVLEFPYASALQVGDCFEAKAIPREYTQEEYFDEEVYRLSDGCLLLLTCSDATDCQILPEQDRGFLVQTLRLNTRLSYLLRERIGGESGGVGAALLLGNRSWIDGDSILDFRRAGVSHLLALSGLHVAILVGFLEFLFRRLRLPIFLKAILIPCLALGYLALTGFAPSTCRAVLMLCVLYLAYLGRARYDPFTALCGVLVLILLFTPYAVLDLSMWMSFLAAGSIIVFSPFLRQVPMPYWIRGLPQFLQKTIVSALSALFVGVVANLALMLLSACVFGEISWMSVPATLLLSIPVTLELVCSLILLCLPFLPFLPRICALLGELILAITAAGSSLENVLLPVWDLPTVIILSLLTLSLILLAVLKISKRRWALVPLGLGFAAVLSAVCVTCFQPQLPSTVTIPAGHGEVVLLACKGDAVLVNDTRGNASEAFVIYRTALEMRCTEIDSLIFCRYYNQATYFIARLSERIKIRTIHLPTPRDAREEAIAARMEQEACLHGISVVYDAEFSGD